MLRRVPVCQKGWESETAGVAIRPVLLLASLAVWSHALSSGIPSARSAQFPPETTNAAGPESTSPNGTRGDAQADRLRERMIEVAQELIRQLPRSEEPMTLMGIVLHGQGKDHQAMEYWRRGLALNPKQSDVLVNMGSVAMNQEQYSEAISHWKSALAIDPKLPGVYLSIGQAYLAQGELDAAIQALQVGLGLTDRPSDYLYYLGKALALQGEYAEAKARYAQVIQAEPTHINAYYGLFTVCSRLGEGQEAQKFLDFYRQHRAEGIQEARDQDNAERLAALKETAAQLYLGVSQVYLKHGKMDRATAILQETVGLKPDHLPALRQLAQLYQQQGRFDQAFAVMLEVTSRAPADPQGHFMAGNLALRLKRYDQAEQAFRRVVELAPASALGYRELARTLYVADRSPAESRRIAEQAVTLQPVAENFFVLGLILIKQGDRVTARAVLQRASQLEPANQQYQKAYDYVKNAP